MDTDPLPLHQCFSNGAAAGREDPPHRLPGNRHPARGSFLAQALKIDQAYRLELLNPQIQER
jgi:hypothetical protein